MYKGHCLELLNTPPHVEVTGLISRKKPIRSLLHLLQGLEHYTNTTVELRNKFTVHGTIQNVDDNMKYMYLACIADHATPLTSHVLCGMGIVTNDDMGKCHLCIHMYTVHVNICNSLESWYVP